MTNALVKKLVLALEKQNPLCLSVFTPVCWCTVCFRPGPCSKTGGNFR
uniref:Uncharacterized protein n=1 Tax=Arundo donax TaxID=35708 RepID=A0A0A9DSV1_ARUDO